MNSTEKTRRKMIKVLTICALVLAIAHLVNQYSTTTRTPVEYVFNTPRELTGVISGVLPEGVFDHLTVSDFYEVCQRMTSVD